MLEVLISSSLAVLCTAQVCRYDINVDVMDCFWWGEGGREARYPCLNYVVRYFGVGVAGKHRFT